MITIPAIIFRCDGPANVNVAGSSFKLEKDCEVVNGEDQRTDLLENEFFCFVASLTQL